MPFRSPPTTLAFYLPEFQRREPSPDGRLVAARPKRHAEGERQAQPVPHEPGDQETSHDRRRQELGALLELLRYAEAEAEWLDLEASAILVHAAAMEVRRQLK